MIDNDFIYSFTNLLCLKFVCIRLSLGQKRWNKHGNVIFYFGGTIIPWYDAASYIKLLIPISAIFYLKYQSNKENMFNTINHLLYRINIYDNYYQLNSFKMNDVAICLDKQGLNLIWHAYFAIISGNDKVQIY